jgi:hypothetical protein
MDKMRRTIKTKTKTTINACLKMRINPFVRFEY